MAVSTREIASELQSHLGKEGAELLFKWLEGMRADLLAVATVVDSETAETIDAVAEITNIEE